MIVRGPRPERFTIVNNRLIRDDRLSFRARGVLVYVLSQRDGWETDSTRLAAQAKEGRGAVRSAIAELEAAGYWVQERHQDPKTGRWVTVATVRDTPEGGFPTDGNDPTTPSEDRFPVVGGDAKPQVSPKTGFRSSGNRTSGNRTSGNRTSGNRTSVSRSLLRSTEKKDQEEEPAAAATKVDDQSDNRSAVDVAQVLTEARLPASWRADVAAALGRGCTVRQIVDTITAQITGDVRNVAAVRRTRLRDLTPAPPPAVTPTPPNVRVMCRTHSQPDPCPVCAEDAAPDNTVSARPVTDNRSSVTPAAFDTTELKKQLSRRTPRAAATG